MPILLAKQHCVLREFSVNFQKRSFMSSSSRSALPPVRLRRALISDVPALFEVEHTSFDGDQLSARQLRHWVDAPNGILLLAHSGAAVLGFCLVFSRADSPAARLYSIAISKAARGQGLGKKLLRRAEALAREQGSASMRLEVAASNHVAIGLYQKLGYHIFGHKPGYYEDGQDAIRMQKAL